MIQQLFGAGDIKKERFGKRPSVTTIHSKKKGCNISYEVTFV
ncbi:hypothetical protein [Bacillus sp. AFS059628]|nr:hypothetical protein [Bacillus sp. AFS059628]